MRRDDARWFRAQLRLFPAEFRGDFGRQMVDDFRDQREETATRRGARGMLRLWFRTVADVLEGVRSCISTLRRNVEIQDLTPFTGRC